MEFKVIYVLKIILKKFRDALIILINISFFDVRLDNFFIDIDNL